MEKNPNEDSIKKIIGYFLSNYNNIRTITAKISSFKKELKKHSNWTPSLLKNITPSKEMTERTRKQNTLLLENRKQRIIKSEDVLNKIKELSSSEDIIHPNTD